MDDRKNTLSDFLSINKRLIGQIVLCLIAIASIFEATKKISEGIKETWTYCILALAILSWLTLIYLSRKREIVTTILSPGGKPIREVSRSPYSSRSFLRIRIAIWTLPIIVIVAALGWSHWRNPPSDIITILLAKFEHDDQQIGLTEQIYDVLTKSTAAYPEVQVKLLDEVITIQQGSEYARQKGMDAKAGIVLWGGYIKTPENVRVSIRIDILREQVAQIISQGDSRLIKPIEELYSFELQDRVASDTTYISLLCLGIARLEAKDYDGAIERLTRAISRKIVPLMEGAYADVYYFRGIAYLNKDNIDLAILDFDTAIKRRPEIAYPYYSRGVARNNKLDFDGAIEDINEYIKLTPKTSLGHIMKGHFLQNKGDFEKAIQEINRVIDFGLVSKENGFLAYTIRAQAHLSNNDFEASLQDLCTALKLKPDDATALALRGNTYRLMHNYDKAEADTKEAIKLQPGNAIAYGMFGKYYDDRDNLALAIEMMNKAIDLSPRNDEFRLERGLVHYRVKAYDLAEADFQDALGLNPNNFRALHWNGIAHSRKNEYDRCIDFATRAIKLRGDRADFYFTRSICLYGRGDLSRALAGVEDAIKLDPNLDGIYSHRGFIHLRMKKNRAAVSDFKKVLEISKDPNLRRNAEEQLKALGAK